MTERSLCIVGAGLRGAVLLERVSASIGELLTGQDLVVHLVDPHPAGSGRTWRDGQPGTLVMNTVAAQSTVFTDATVQCAGPIVPGPSFLEWCEAVADGGTAAPGLPPALRAEAARTRDWSNPSRLLYGHYLRWAHARTVAALPPGIRLVEHGARAIAVTETGDADTGGPAWELQLDNGSSLSADAVVLALGWLPVTPSATESELAAAVADAQLDWVAPDNPIDQDLSRVRAGEPVIVRGLGMSFFDTVSMLTEGRGGRFVEREHGLDPHRLQYLPSGAEPVIHAGSRRGLVFRAKSHYGAPPPPSPQRLLRAALPALLREERIDFGRQVRPLIDADATAAYYETLARLRPHALARPVAQLLLALEAHGTSSPQWRQALAQGVPDAADRLDLAHVERPLPQSFASAEEFTARTIAAVHADAEQAALGADSPLKAALLSIGASRLTIVPLVEFGRLSAESFAGSYQDFQAFAGILGSGPPLFRSRQLLALLRAGIVRPLGPELQLRVQGGRFEASSPRVPAHTVRARTLVDAWLPLPAGRRSAEPLLRSVLEQGLARPFRIDGLETGALDISPHDNALVRADGAAHRSLFSVGVPSEDARIFTIIAPIPGVNSTVLRELDATARAALASIATTRGTHR
ncbi:FAD/NAD(P)-binding protein [Microterricola pindariensis]|uniref:FAD-dependent urate hydroxylase HpyO/Asp monooxygenase CreE-like FAD/NAD(P)-binding domain-containing protein n=1 Tax=Microterricola pindariensis TaxID=478010 RepID=A0ABX5B0C8_9MICO|nr:FAD/NAD(P)-binding protein [Microterricola pindariensis]PPL20255.1 hypothetical protein GY24_01545 [Microterricola pindariensis]